ncbi:MAG TPA: T9SS type A sorting domain-containing protein [Chryseolinea sp.]
MKRCLIVAILLVCSTFLFGQSPGGISTNLLWWLKANAGVYVDNGVTLAANGQTVQFWRDQSTSANHATTAVAGNRPTYVTNVINGNPALRFTLDHFLDAGSVSGIGGTQSFYIFLVFNQSAYSPGTPTDNAGTFIIDRPSDTNSLTSFKVVNTDKYCYQRRDDGRLNAGGPVTATPVATDAFGIADYFRNYVSAASSTEGIYLNGRLDVSQAGPTTSMTGPPIRIGRHALGVNLGLNGYFSEIAVYNANLTSAQRQRIESYLALKYGITLDQTILTDYVRSDGTVIYPASTTRSGFVADIAGVGRDNAAAGSGLYQTASQSQNANSILNISILNPALTLANNEFLVWGSNNASLSSTNSSDVDGVFIKQRLSRVWRASEVGDVGLNTVSFDLSSLPGPLNGSNLRVLIDSDGTFAAGSISYLGTLSGTTFTASINLTNGDFFTLATTNTTTSPLPVTLENFTVTYEHPAVVASWKTATELNNDHFTLERSGTDLSFGNVARVAGAGTSNIPHTYSALDTDPFEGRSYYRLKQTDFDGKVTYSGTQTIFIEPSGKKLSVFPNPADGSKPWKLKYGNDTFQLDRVEIMDEQGRLLEVITPENKKEKEFAIHPRKLLTPGLYVLNVHYNNKQEFVKLVVR